MSVSLSAAMQSLDDSEVAAADPKLALSGLPKVARFRVGGEPFDLTWDLILSDRCADTLLRSSAEWALRDACFDAQDKYDARVPLVLLARDIRSFRLIYNYVQTGVFIVPPDAVDRAIMLGEAAYYGYTRLVAQLTGATAGVPSSIPGAQQTRGKNEAPANDADAATPALTGKDEGKYDDEPAPVIIRAGFVAPSRAIVSSMRQMNLPSVPIVPAIAADFDVTTLAFIQKSGEPLADGLSAADTDARAWEYAARLRFGQDLDASAGVAKQLVDVFASPDLVADCNRRVAVEPGYRHLLWSYEHGAGAADRPPVRLTETLPQFERQLDVLTSGLLLPALAGLPLVLAGGAVLAALHAWPRAPVPADAHRAFAGLHSVQELCACFRAQVTEGGGVFYPDDRRGRRIRASHRGEFETLQDEVRRLRDELYGGAGNINAAAQAPVVFTNDQEDILGLYALMSAIKWDDAQTHYHSVACPGATIQGEQVLRSFRTTDADLFLITRDPDEALRAIATLYARLQAAVGDGPIEIIRTDHSVTFRFPKSWHCRPIQVVTRLYRSVGHVLLGFDLDCCAFAYVPSAEQTHARVMGLPRAVRALQTRSNLIDPTRQSTSYEYRLAKYAKRGFSCVAPGVDPALYARGVVRALYGRSTGRAPALLTGYNLLIAKLFRQFKARGDKLVAQKFLPADMEVSDYGDSKKSYRDRVIYASRGALLPFVYGTNLGAVLFANTSATTLRAGTPMVAASTVAPSIVFQAAAPQRQDREDTLYTGAFHPTEHAYFAVLPDE